MNSHNRHEVNLSFFCSAPLMLQHCALLEGRFSLRGISEKVCSLNIAHQPKHHVVLMTLHRVKLVSEISHIHYFAGLRNC